MKKIYKYAIIAFFGITAKGFAQVNVSSFPNTTIVTDHPFLDASGYTNDVPNNQNKGLYFPSTNLTTWEFKTNMLDGITFPTAYNGMVVYNTGTGNTVADVTKGGLVVSVKPGFYYFYNPNNVGGTSISTGYWKAFEGDAAAAAIEPWNKRLTTTKATLNGDNIYQQGNVAIGTQNGVGTFHVDAAKNNPTSGTPTATNVLDDIITTSEGRIGFGYNPSDEIIPATPPFTTTARQVDDKVTFQANDDLDVNYSLATTSNAQAIVHRNIISNGTVAARTARPNGTSIVAFEGHTSTSNSSYGLTTAVTQQRAGIVLRTGKENNVGGEIWFGVSGASAGDGGKTLDATAGVKYRAVMDQRGNWAFGSDPNFDAFYRKPSERIDLILGGMRIGALGYGPLAAWKVQEIAERPNYISTNPNDRVVVADENGVLKVKEASALVPTITTNNGITKNTTTSEIELGGALNRPTTITTDASTFPLNITGLIAGTTTDNVVLSSTGGQLKTISSANLVQEPWLVIGADTQANSNTQNIYQMGNVAIGATTAPSFPVGATTVQPKLHIAGDVSTTGKYYTTNSVYADYVFEKYFNGSSNINPNYEFKSLSYVRDFIKANNHLPGVESIADLAKAENGYTFDMTKLTVQSLEKIEELYLHTIEQQDKIDAQQIEIDQLKKQSQEIQDRVMRLEQLLDVNKH